MRSPGRPLALALAACLGVAGLVACGGGDKGDAAGTTTTRVATSTTGKATTTTSRSTTSTATTATSTSTTAASTTTTSVTPSTVSPSPSTTIAVSGGRASPEEAARALYDYWRAGDRDGAGTVATDGAADTLFSHPPGSLSFLGCTSDGGTWGCQYASADRQLTFRAQGGTTGGYKVVEIVDLSD